MSFFHAEGLSFHYGRSGIPVLRDFSMKMEQGETVGLVGDSGSGKSTLLRIVAGLEEPTGGRVLLQERVLVDGRTLVQPEHRGIGMMFQDYGLFPHMTVEQNIRFGLHRLGRREREIRLGEMLELVSLKPFCKRYPHELSGGQQQRAAFARSLAPRPAMLLMDEPFSSLDAGLKDGIRRELKQLLEATGITAILVTHDQEDAAALCSRIVRMPSSAAVREKAGAEQEAFAG